MSFEQVLAGATLEKDRKRKEKNVPLKKRNDRQSILHEIFNNDRLPRQSSITHRYSRNKERPTSVLAFGISANYTEQLGTEWPFLPVEASSRKWICWLAALCQSRLYFEHHCPVRQTRRILPFSSEYYHIQEVLWLNTKWLLVRYREFCEFSPRGECEDRITISNRLRLVFFLTFFSFFFPFLLI